MPAVVVPLSYVYVCVRMVGSVNAIAPLWQWIMGSVWSCLTAGVVPWVSCNGNSQRAMEAKAYMADKGRFDVLDSIMNPEPPVKVVRKKKAKKVPDSNQQTGDSRPSTSANVLQAPEPPILLRNDAPPKKVRDASKMTTCMCGVMVSCRIVGVSCRV